MNHILVVDDAHMDRELAGELLQSGTSFHVEFASNGMDALEQLEANLPVAVVTDLAMPEMDGMELVKVIRQRFPSVPVILMTGRGSEDIALQSLLAGATDYVPKDHLAHELVSAVLQAITLASANRPHQRLAHCLRRFETQYELDNDLLLIAPLVEQYRQAAEELGLVREHESLQFGKSVAEALRNGIYHGNLELSAAPTPAAPGLDLIEQRRNQPVFRDRRLHVDGVFTRVEARITIRDEGSGFDHASIRDARTDPRCLVQGKGRGLVLIHMFMDEVTFNPAGNEITMVRRAR